jgi:hypothetical protein
LPAEVVLDEAVRIDPHLRLVLLGAVHVVLAWAMIARSNNRHAHFRKSVLLNIAGHHERSNPLEVLGREHVA